MKTILPTISAPGLAIVTLLASVLIATLFSVTAPVFATEPTTPIQIITPEDLSRSGKFTTDQVEVVFRENEISGFKTLLILFKNGKRIDQFGLDLRPKRVQNQDDESKKGLSIARMKAVPDDFWKRVEPGVYAHKIRIEANLKDGAGSLIEEEWVRWRTDGKRFELLNIERYSALVEKVEFTTDADGKQVMVLTGKDVKLDKPGEATMEALGTQIGSEGVRLEQPVKQKKQELERSLDERNED